MSESPAAPDRIRVFVVDDHALVRQGMRAFFEMLDDLAVVGEAADGRSALDQLAVLDARDELPDVVVMDLVMPGLDGIDATARIKERYPGVEVLALTSFSEEDQVHGALRAGATGYLLKDATPDELAAAVRAAFHGETHLHRAIARLLTRSFRGEERERISFTPREREVLELLAQGGSNRDIAKALFISERTVRTHVSNLLAKLNVSSRMQAALWAVRGGVTPKDG